MFWNLDLVWKSAAAILTTYAPYPKKILESNIQVACSVLPFPKVCMLTAVYIVYAGYILMYKDMHTVHAIKISLNIEEKILQSHLDVSPQHSEILSVIP